MIDRMQVAIRSVHPWVKTEIGELRLWMAGAGCPETAESLIGRFALGLPSEDGITTWLREIEGNFAFVLTGPGWGIAAVDRIRSLPLVYSLATGVPLVGDSAASLLGELPPGTVAVSSAASTTLAMAGYTLGSSTLYDNIHQLRPGEYLVAAGMVCCVRRYYVYRPWRPTKYCSWVVERNLLAETTLAVLRKVIERAAGRQIAVPLSAGLDSRLIASGLARLGYRNVRCFAYGQPGNFEAKASKAIAGQLGHQWAFVAHTQMRQKDTFQSALYKEYLRYSDCGTAVPFPQDFLPVRELTESGWLDSDAIVVNGNSGDFISGDHVPGVLLAPPPDAAEDTRLQRILDALVGKHFSLWKSLLNRENVALVTRQIRTELDAAGAELGDPASDFGLYEFVEWQERQCKYVVTGQRVYEFFGRDWALPLWDKDYLDYWERQPLHHKTAQRLYHEMLMHENWGGVWKGISVRRNITPSWLRPIRLALKACFALSPRNGWHDFERQYLKYWMDIVCNYAQDPYLKIALDRRGFRNAISWHVEAFLNSKNLQVSAEFGKILPKD